MSKDKERGYANITFKAKGPVPRGSKITLDGQPIEDYVCGIEVKSYAGEIAEVRLDIIPENVDISIEDAQIIVIVGGKEYILVGIKGASLEEVDVTSTKGTIRKYPARNYPNRTTSKTNPEYQTGGVVKDGVLIK